MPAVELLVFGTIAAGVLSWAAGEVLASRAWWTAGALLTLLHSVVAFFVFYEGSHQIAQAETMKQTAALTGVVFPGGIYVNYTFLLVWLGDAAWWWLSPHSRAARPRGLTWVVRGFIFFIIVNGAVVFADGWARVVGLIAVAAVTIANVPRPDSGTRTPPRRFFYGWVIVAVAALAMVGTLPGRTQGLGLITEPLLADLGVTRVAYAQLNLFATLAGALFAFGVGKWIDRRGSRRVLTLIAFALGVVVVTMSQVRGTSALLVAVTLTRGLGQTALSIVSLAMVGKWFQARLTWAMGVYSVAMSVGFMLAFPAVGALVIASGWREAWAAVGVFLLVVLVPVAWIYTRSTPADIGEVVDGARAPAVVSAGAEAELRTGAASATLAEALQSPAFWVFAVASSMYGLVASGIGLFNEAILAERGFAPTVYHSALAVTAITGLAGNFVAGAWAERSSLRGILVVAMIVLGGALAALPHVSTTMHVMLQAVAMGIAGGFVMVIFFSFWGRAYGDAHLGRIQGAAQVMTVLFSALGPLLLAWCVEATGSYALAFYGLAAAVALLAATAALVPIPARALATASVPSARRTN
jgi:MFS family permease